MPKLDDRDPSIRPPVLITNSRGGFCSPGASHDRVLGGPLYGLIRRREHRGVRIAPFDRGASLTDGVRIGRVQRLCRATISVRTVSNGVMIHLIHPQRSPVGVQLLRIAELYGKPLRRDRREERILRAPHARHRVRPNRRDLLWLRIWSWSASERARSSLSERWYQSR